MPTVVGGRRPIPTLKIALKMTHHPFQTQRFWPWMHHVIKTCSYQLCKRQSADTDVLIGRYRLLADYQCVSRQYMAQNVCFNDCNCISLCSFDRQLTDNSNKHNWHDVIAAVFTLDICTPAVVDDVINQQLSHAEIRPAPDITCLLVAKRPHHWCHKLVNSRERSWTTTAARLHTAGNLETTQ